MTDSHLYTFFGKNMGLIVRSFSKTDPFLFLHMIKRKLNGEWEKPSSNEGKMIKISLEELILILQVAERKKNSWKTEHEYNNNITEIMINWEGNTDERLWIFVDKYSKVLNSGEIELFHRLLTHILEEKIEFSTNSHNLKQLEDKQLDKENYSKDNILVKVQGMIKKSTKKALLIIFGNSTETWIPKSSIQNDYNIAFKGTQSFLIEQWILQKKGIIP